MGDGWAYAALEPVATPSTVPSGWPPGWGIPDDATDPWPPGWPTAGTGEYDDYTLVTDAPAAIGPEEPATVEAYALDDGAANASDLNLHVIRSSAKIGATTVQVKESGGTFADYWYGQVSNYSGSRYGVSQALIFDIDEGDEGSTVTVLVEIVSTSPEIEDSDTTTVEAGVDYAAVASTGNLTLSGNQTIDGVAITTQRVCAWKQTTASENGLYTAASGAWTLIKAFDSNMLYKPIFISSGTVFASSVLWVTASNTATFRRVAYHVQACTTGNHALSGTAGLVDATIAAGDLVLAPYQTTASENGIYVVQASTWTKIASFAAADIGTSISVGAGTIFANSTFYVTAANTVAWRRAAHRVACATRGDHALSGTAGLVDATIAAGDLILAWLQTTASQNGIYIVQSSTWTKIASFAAADIGMAIHVGAGTIFGQNMFLVTAVNAATWRRGAYKAKLATTADHGLSGTSNVDSVAISAGDVVMAWIQSTASQNGLYIVAASGTWPKIASFAAGDVGTQVGVSAGTLYGKLNFICTAANTVVAGGAVFL